MNDIQSLSALKASVHEDEFKTQKNLSYEETYAYIAKAIEDNKVAKIRETQKSENTQKIVKDKAYYRENFSFYFKLIKNELLTNGIKTFRMEDGKAVNMDVNETASDIAAGYVGWDCLEDAMNDDKVTDIFVISWNKIFVERKGKNEVYKKTFRSQTAYKNFVDRIVREAGKQLDSGENKIVDFELYGNRGNVVHESVATKGACLTLRKHSEDPITLEQLLGWNLMTKDISDMLGMAVEGETNLIYAGITGSGKTTTIRALLNYYIAKLNKRALVLEDTQELFLSNPHTVDLKTFPTDDPKTSITLRDLNISALRMKPKYIIVGEVRGAEAESAVEGMETGHSTIFTMHGGNVWNVVNRLVTKYLMQMPTLGIEVVERIIGEAVNFVCIQDDIPGIGRRITSIHEIGYDFQNHCVTATPIVSFNFATKDWDWLNPLSNEVLNTMTRRGVSYERANALNEMIANNIEKTKQRKAQESDPLKRKKEA